MVVGIVQESRPGPLFGPSVQRKWAERSLCGGGEHQDHSPMLSYCPRRHEGDHHEGGFTKKHSHTHEQAHTEKERQIDHSVFLSACLCVSSSRSTTAGTLGVETRPLLSRLTPPLPSAPVSSLCGWMVALVMTSDLRMFF